MAGETFEFRDFGEVVEPKKPDTESGEKGNGTPEGKKSAFEEEVDFIGMPEKETKEEPVKEPEKKEEIPSEYESDAERLVYEGMAKERGWVSKDKFRGDEKTFKSAKQFVKDVFDINASLQRGNETQKRINKELQDSLRQLREHDKKVLEKERDRHIKELTEARRQAILEANVEQVESIDKEIDDVRTSYDGTEPNSNANMVELAEWQEKNEWYGKDKHLTMIADYITKSPENAGLSFTNILKLIDKEVEEYNALHAKPVTRESETEKEQPVRRASTVESGATKAPQQRKGKYTKADLSPMQLSIAQNFVKTGAFKDIQEYVDDLARMGELG